ncbi:hypothetical protein DRN98_07670 [Methanosarcinales archaeon]|nr:MAG: hypothetical protein DRN98_07670 [Methanosarcinales archaeon]
MWFYKKGLTLTEAIVGMAVLGIIIPLVMFPLVKFIESTNFKYTLFKAQNICSLELERISSRLYSPGYFEKLGSEIFPNYENTGLKLQRVVKTKDRYGLKEVEVRVYNNKKLIYKVCTYFSKELRRKVWLKYPKKA